MISSYSNVDWGGRSFLTMKYCIYIILMAREGSICHGDTAMLVLCYYM